MLTNIRGDDRFRLAVDASPAAMVMVDANGLIEFANAETERMFGYAVFELIGQSIDILVPSRSRDAHAGMRQSFFANRSARPMGAGRDLYGARKDGREFPVEIALTPIEAEFGPIALATIVDITARRAAEEELARRAADLEIANERLTQFAYVASHDLQEPLRKIAIFADLLEDAIARSDAERHRPRHRGHQELGRPRATHGRQPPQLLARRPAAETQLEPLDLRAEVDLALGDLSAAIEETGARIDLDVPPIMVRADRAQLGRLIQNIVSNALKYHKPGAAPAIAIRAGPGRPGPGVRSPSPTPGSASTRNSPSRFSSRSSGCTTCGISPARALGSRSARRSPTGTAGRSTPARGPARARRSR